MKEAVKDHITKEKKPVRKVRKTKKEPLYLRSGVYNFEPDWGFEGELEHIEVIPNTKIHIKWDRRIIFPKGMLDNIYEENIPADSIALDQSNWADWIPPELEKANKVLAKHPIRTASQDQLKQLDLLMEFLSAQSQCAGIPIFLTMATIGDDLYWQLVENFIYTLVKYNLSDCGLIICVSDDKCLRKCQDYSFPCFNYHAERKDASLPVMEQIAILKLAHIPKALLQGVDVFMLDLDVGFLADPSLMLKVYRATPQVDIFVQEDFIFLMNRTAAGWRTWYTEPLPNIGMFLCRGNNRTAEVFRIALENYLTLKDPEVRTTSLLLCSLILSSFLSFLIPCFAVKEKAKPGIDQKKVLNAIQIGRGTFALKFAYFTTSTAPLLDKFIKQHGNLYELGGELMLQALRAQKALAMHTTCYEKSTKVMGLKASSAFWNPRYYDSHRRTITKQLLFADEDQLREEVRSLVWLAMVTGRSLIIPNVLGDETKIHTIAPYQGNRTLWPGFRVANIASAVRVSVLEPQYYWRLEKDYSDPVPAPQVVYFTKGESLVSIRKKLGDLGDIPRIVLHAKPPRSRLRKGKNRGREGASEGAQEDILNKLKAWADDSVGDFGDESFAELFAAYRSLPPLEKALSRLELAEEREMAQIVSKGVRTCYGVFGPSKGNSTCFQICE